jgi:hypothetical protein
VAVAHRIELEVSHKESHNKRSDQPFVASWAAHSVVVVVVDGAVVDAAVASD